MEKNLPTPTAPTDASHGLSRRDFLGKRVLLGAGLALGPALLAASAQPKTTGVALKTRQLGKLPVSELGAGCMSSSANYGNLSKITKLLPAATYSFQAIAYTFQAASRRCNITRPLDRFPRAKSA